MLSYEESLKILKETNALLEGHFILSSGLHSKQYIQCAKLLSNPKQAKSICSSLCEKINNNFNKIDIVLSPAIGGIVVGYEVGRQLNVQTIFAERIDNKLIKILKSIQNDLFNLGTQLAVVEYEKSGDFPQLSIDTLTKLESEIDYYNSSLDELRSFVLPGDSMITAQFHIARNVCRRAERRVITLIMVTTPNNNFQGNTFDLRSFLAVCFWLCTPGLFLCDVL